MKNLIFVLLSLLIGLPALAEVIPKNCKTDQFTNDKNRLILHTQINHQPQLVLLNNFSKEELLVNHVVVHPSASSGWSSYLRPGNWSALMVVQPKFALLCHIIKSGKYIPVECGKVLKTCYFSDFKDEDKIATGTYWLIEDTTLPKVMQNISAQKIFIDTPS